MNHLEKLLDEYLTAVPDGDQIAFVGGIASVAQWIADYPEDEWPKAMDEMIANVTKFYLDAAAAIEEVRNNPTPKP